MSGHIVTESKSHCSVSNGSFLVPGAPGQQPVCWKLLLWDPASGVKMYLCHFLLLLELYFLHLSFFPTKAHLVCHFYSPEKKNHQLWEFSGALEIVMPLLNTFSQKFYSFYITFAKVPLVSQGLSPKCFKIAHPTHDWIYFPLLDNTWLWIWTLPWESGSFIPT